VAGDPVTVTVRRSMRARSARITVRPREPVDVVIPGTAGPDDLARFLREKQGWLEDKVAWARRWDERPPVLGLDRPGVVWVLGRPVGVRAVEGGRSAARLGGGMLTVRGPAEDRAAAVARWYRREARARFEERARSEAPGLGVDVRSVAIRDGRTRWASCSSRGTLSFSWRLLLAPAYVVDSVVAHELCHRRVPSHSRRFWRTLDAAMPGWRVGDRWLAELGHELYAYDPAAACRPVSSVAPAVGEVARV
jgi:predicted metal-dependent hydrolase